jgi:hypothetical protein
MQAFINKHAGQIIGVLHGYDRMRFRGTLRSIAYGDGFEAFLAAKGVRYAQFATFVQEQSALLKDHLEQIAVRAGRPSLYLGSSQQSKEAMALQIARRDGITQGLICLLRCVEPCMSFCLRRDPRSGKFAFVRQQRKCLFGYLYYLDREFGLMHVRVQTWMPFDMTICLNGREYLAQQMRQAGLGFEQRDNCFTRIDDLPRAQAMLSKLESRNWQRMLGAIGRRVNPLVKKLGLRDYYWSLAESEYATDVTFKSEKDLAELYPALVEHAMRQMGCRDVLRFLGRRPQRSFDGEVSTNILHRKEGIRIKHWVQENSIKMYDKQPNLLRIETTLNNVRRFSVRRAAVRRGKRVERWYPMRQGVMDIRRRSELGLLANRRYLEALAVVAEPSPTRQVLDPVSRSLCQQGRRYRGLRPIGKEDAAVFATVMQGQFQLKGFANKDVRAALFGTTGGRCTEATEKRRVCGKITRWLRLLRAHGLIRKVSHTRYYRVTANGQKVMSTALKIRECDVSSLAIAA